MSHSSQREAQASVQAHAATPTPTDSKRRRFLLALGAGGASAPAVATQSIAAPVAATVPAAPTAAQGYRETEHVRDYYATTRI